MGLCTAATGNGDKSGTMYSSHWKWRQKWDYVQQPLEMETKVGLCTAATGNGDKSGTMYSSHWKWRQKWDYVQQPLEMETKEVNVENTQLSL